MRKFVFYFACIFSCATLAFGASVGSQAAVRGGEAEDAVWHLWADENDDVTDKWAFESEAADNDLSILNHDVEMVKVDTNGNVTVTGTITSTGAQTSSVVSNETGTLVMSNGTFNGNVTIGGTLGVTGASTFDGNVTVSANADLIAISDDGASTNTLVSDGVIDGEHLDDDSVDDDSIDFTDVTAADFGVPLSVDGVQNAGGDIDFVEGGNIDITPSDGANTITFANSAVETYTVTSLNVTNNHALTVASTIYLLNGIGQADNATNTMTLANPTSAGQVVYLIVATASSNLITIADSGNVAASGAILLDGNDSTLLVAPTSSLWVETPGDN